MVRDRGIRMPKALIASALLVSFALPAAACDHPGPLYAQTGQFADAICKGFPDDAPRDDRFTNAPSFAGMRPAESKHPSKGDGGYELYVAYDRTHHLQYIQRLDIQPLAERATESMTYALVEAAKPPARVNTFADLSRVATQSGLHVGATEGSATSCTGEAIYRLPGPGYRGDGTRGVDLWLNRGRILGIRFWGEPA